MDEQYEVVGENGRLTGQLVSKHVAHTTKILHRVAGMMLHDENGRYVLQYRPTKQGIYYYDASVGGHVDIGEVPRMAALREAKEELGVVLDMRDLVLVAEDLLVDDFYPERGIYGRHLCTFWEGQLPRGWKFVANHEVKEVRLLTRDEIVTICREHPEECTKGFVAGVKAMGWL